MKTGRRFFAVFVAHAGWPSNTLHPVFDHRLVRKCLRYFHALRKQDASYALCCSIRELTSACRGFLFVLS
jgi:hypothetical protein